MYVTFSCLHVHAPGPAAANPAIQHTEAASEESDDEDESFESANGADPGKVMFTHITPPLSLFLSLLDTAVPVCRHYTVLLCAAVYDCRLHHSQSPPPFMYMHF